MATKYSLSQQSYAKIVLHCAKYPLVSVNGLLLGNLSGSILLVEDAVPLFHNVLPLSPMLEIALQQVDVYAKQTGQKIIGSYSASELLTDVEPSPMTIKLAQKLDENSGNIPALLLVVNNEKLPSEVAVREFSGALQLLPEAESEQVNRFKFRVDQLRALAGRLLTRHAIIKLTDLNWTDIHIQRSPEGKPFLNSRTHKVQFNLSHHGSWVVLAAHNSEAPLGIDVCSLEEPKEDVNEFYSAFESVFTSKEWKIIQDAKSAEHALVDKMNSKLGRFYAFWCAKEAYTKSIGLGLGAELLEIEIRFGFPSPALKSAVLVKDRNGGVFLKGKKESCDLYRGFLDDEHIVTLILPNGTNPEEFPVQQITFQDIIENQLY
ncbi:hypothetical protein HK096_005601 [Nowakowskiella sp. JEL0078]|nr:hypothetical protein HK096_005601 [Nowakowskiella sp. JEL0078]